MRGEEEWLTLAQAAERLGVHYMTVYRWVRTGRVEAVKSGGEWQVAASALVAAHRPAVVGRRSAPAREVAQERLSRRAVVGDEPGAWAVVESVLAGGADPVKVYLELLCPTMADIGARWAAGDLTVADEHRATAVVTRIIGRLGPRMARPGRRRGSVALGSVAGDHHALPTALLADVVRAAGYDVVDLGADSPAEVFVAGVGSLDVPLAVGIGCATEDGRAAVAATTAALRRSDPDVLLVAGGAGIGSARTASELGADDWARDALSLLRILDDHHGRLTQAAGA